MSEWIRYVYNGEEWLTVEEVTDWLRLSRWGGRKYVMDRGLVNRASHFKHSHIFPLIKKSRLLNYIGGLND